MYKNEKKFFSKEKTEQKKKIRFKEKRIAFQKTTLYKRKINMSKNFYKQDSNTNEFRHQK